MTKPKIRVVSKEGDTTAIVEDRTIEVGLGREPVGVAAVSQKTLDELGMTAEEYYKILRQALLGV